MAKKITKNIRTLERMEVVDADINSMHPNDYNPNRQSDREFELLCRSIEEDGFTQPILVHKDTMEIIDGEHRWRACKALGWETIPTVYTDMTKEQQMIATLRHNRARGNEDISKAADVLRDIQNLGALDHASDSLLLDDVELKIMLEDIPQAELVLRNPEKKMTVKEVETIIKEEQRFNEAKAQEDTDKQREERDSTFTYILRYYQYEQRQVLDTFKALGMTSNTECAIALLELYENDAEAIAFINSADEHAWQGREKWQKSS